MREWWEAAINTDEASLTGLKLTSCCGGLVPNRPKTGTGPDPLCWYWYSCSKTNSGTLCKTSNPASSLFLNRWMALKLGEEQLFSPKGKQPSATYNFILSINCEKTSVFWASGKFAHGLDIKCSFFGEKRAFFFHILSFYHKYSLSRFGEMFILSLQYFRENQ